MRWVAIATLGFFARRLYGFEGLCDVSAVLLVFLAIPHAVSYSASQMDAMRAPHFVSHDFAR